MLQCGVFCQELLTALTGHGTVAVSENTRRDNPFIRHVIPHGVDTRIFQPMPREKTAEPSIVFVGTREGRKRGAFLLEVFQRIVRPAHPDAILMFVGPPGPPVPGVSYHTGVSDAELASLYRRAWLYASPSTYEGFGLPYLEAMACGTAVVATPNPGSREVLGDGEYGRLVDDAAFGPMIELLAARAAGARSKRRDCCGPGNFRSIDDRSVRRLTHGAVRSACGISRLSLANSSSRFALQLPEDVEASRQPSRATRGAGSRCSCSPQVFWGVLLFLPGSQAFRTYIRAFPYVTSLVALVACARSSGTDTAACRARAGSSRCSCS